MPDTYDVIVVDARCAHAPTATLLARRGLPVPIIGRAWLPISPYRTPAALLTRGVSLIASARQEAA